MSGSFVTTTDLLAIGLITREQLEALEEHGAEEWARAWDDSRWWHALAKIAWSNQASGWQKFINAWVAPYSWTADWLEENRGW